MNKSFFENTRHHHPITHRKVPFISHRKEVERCWHDPPWFFERGLCVYYQFCSREESIVDESCQNSVYIPAPVWVELLVIRSEYLLGLFALLLCLKYEVIVDISIILYRWKRGKASESRQGRHGELAVSCADCSHLLRSCMTSQTCSTQQWKRIEVGVF